MEINFSLETIPTLLNKISRYSKKTEKHIRTKKSVFILKQVMINTKPEIWVKQCNTNFIKYFPFSTIQIIETDI